MSQLVPTERGCPDQKLIWVRGVRSNHRPVEYESTALPLSYLAQLQLQVQVQLQLQLQVQVQVQVQVLNQQVGRIERLSMHGLEDRLHTICLPARIKNLAARSGNDPLLPG